jgi:signal transduction histidine kinase
MPLTDFFTQNIVGIFFLYGLAFFSMGLAVWLESGRSSELAFAQALRPLAGFGILHGAHEWLEMSQKVAAIGCEGYVSPLWIEIIRLVLLVVSFLLLTVFGVCLIRSERNALRRYCALAVIPSIVWLLAVIGVRVWMQPSLSEWLTAADVLSRYLIAIPGALIASIALIRQQRAFRERGMERFGRDLLWAAIAFLWYGVAGQIFTRRSIVFPSTIFNSDLFLSVFGFPVQLLRAATASMVAIFVIRALRAFDQERQQTLAVANEARLKLQQEMLHRVVAAQEAERQRIARELHDETSQTLTALAMGLKGVEQIMQADPARAQRQLDNLKKMASDSMDSLRRFIADLRPFQLDDLGLVAALRWYVDEFRQRVPISVVMNVQGTRRRLSPQLETVLFRVTQEALTNVARHAQAQHAVVSLIFSEHQVELTVIDDGRGFVAEEVLGATAQRRAWGLLGIRERATLVGGTWQIKSHPGQGTEITIVVPDLEK